MERRLTIVAEISGVIAAAAGVAALFVSNRPDPPATVKPSAVSSASPSLPNAPSGQGGGLREWFSQVGDAAQQFGQGWTVGALAGWGFALFIVLLVIAYILRMNYALPGPIAFPVIGLSGLLLWILWPSLLS
ncbi:hypothetical protein [Nonomuraea sp. B19D2]|uniref:hypothetical protein n=1 Tax=Nonomuraea sp. B19D2 TaxID=3159561 RepID=UPI0032DA1CE5